MNEGCGEGEEISSVFEGYGPAGLEQKSVGTEGRLLGVRKCFVREYLVEYKKMFYRSRSRKTNFTGQIVEIG